MDVLAFSDGDFHIKMHIRNKADNFIWSLVAVYGPAQEEFKSAFLCEMVNLAKDNPHPFIIGGDFKFVIHSRKAGVGLTIVGLFCSTRSLTVWT